MHIILKTRSSDENYNGDCDYAVVDLTVALAEEVRHRVAIARQALKQCGHLYELYFWDGAADFYDQNLLVACQEAVAHGLGLEHVDRDWLNDFEQQGYAVVPVGVDLTALEAQRTEVDQMIVRCGASSFQPEFNIAWTASPKFTDVYVTTCELPLAAIEGLLTATDPQPVR
jgi:hypothetical protein